MNISNMCLFLYQLVEIQAEEFLGMSRITFILICFITLSTWIRLKTHVNKDMHNFPNMSLLKVNQKAKML